MVKIVGGTVCCLCDCSFGEWEDVKVYVKTSDSGWRGKKGMDSVSGYEGGGDKSGAARMHAPPREDVSNAVFPFRVYLTVMPRL